MPAPPITERQGTSPIAPQEISPTGSHASSASRKASKMFSPKSQEYPQRSSRVSPSVKKS
ncbi:UNVERIFIED_CONTAM: hypothetical protein Sangu_2162300 [Sesamum angustifolium]|uniref:Uncharacterized protein n=1 Tax=Sesamum angustifolium TaxID=2727405 RepID=A0AAW2LED8_9LAMI